MLEWLYNLIYPKKEIVNSTNNSIIIDFTIITNSESTIDKSQQIVSPARSLPKNIDENNIKNITFIHISSNEILQMKEKLRKTNTKEFSKEITEFENKILNRRCNLREDNTESEITNGSDNEW